MPPVGGCREDEATFVEKPGAPPAQSRCSGNAQCGGQAELVGVGSPVPAASLGPLTLSLPRAYQVLRSGARGGAESWGPSPGAVSTLLFLG